MTIFCNKISTQLKIFGFLCDVSKGVSLPLWSCWKHEKCFLKFNKKRAIQSNGTIFWHVNLQEITFKMTTKQKGSIGQFSCNVNFLMYQQSINLLLVQHQFQGVYMLNVAARSIPLYSKDAEFNVDFEIDNFCNKML